MHRVLLLLLIVALLLRTPTCSGKRNPNPNPKCRSSCGDIHNISSPFRLKGDPKGCGHPRYELSCENNRPVFYLYNGRYYVRSITYSGTIYVFGGIHVTGGVIRLVDDGLANDNLTSLPRYSLTCSNFTDSLDFRIPYFHESCETVSILNCSKPGAFPSYVTATESYVKTAHNHSSNISRTNSYYLKAVLNASASQVEDFCTIYQAMLLPYLSPEEGNQLNSSYDHILNMMRDGFDLSFEYPRLLFLLDPSPSKKLFICHFVLQYVPAFRGWCRYHNVERHHVGPTVPDNMDYILEGNVGDTIVVLASFIAAKFTMGGPFVLIFLIYKWRRRHLAMDANIEEFLQANNNFLPIRYSYSNIKKITNNFKHKLGEGGYGSVYKGKLRSGSEVAIKVLKRSKENGQDFINEIATIGRIYHVNVVHLIGFCFDGSKQALVYHFMPNGSLDKYIFSKKEGTLLDCKKIHEIALGVARGIEYLHRGCNMQILHFDIKPHNILLDENFIPKVSDFGLARLYPTNRSIVSLTAVRGTLGYMAPEFFYKNIGGISYKADVYSFGRLLMEMAGRRKNSIINSEQSSQDYFPQWVYEQLNKGEVVKLMDIVEEEREMVKKMIIVALWCIQLNPSHRPSMKRVINMLEGDIDGLQMPPKPLLYPTNPTPIGNGETEIELEKFSFSSSTPVNSSFRFENTGQFWEANAL